MRRAAHFAVAITAAAVVGGCSPTPARSRVVPGHTAMRRDVTPGTTWIIEITPPPRVYVPTEAEARK